MFTRLFFEKWAVNDIGIILYSYDVARMSADQFSTNIMCFQAISSAYFKLLYSSTFLPFIIHI